MEQTAPRGSGIGSDSRDEGLREGRSGLSNAWDGPFKERKRWSKGRTLHGGGEVLSYSFS